MHIFKKYIFGVIIRVPSGNSRISLYSKKTISFIYLVFAQSSIKVVQVEFSSFLSLFKKIFYML